MQRKFAESTCMKELFHANAFDKLALHGFKGYTALYRNAKYIIPCSFHRLHCDLISYVFIRTIRQYLIYSAILYIAGLWAFFWLEHLKRRFLNAEFYSHIRDQDVNLLQTAAKGSADAGEYNTKPFTRF
jgi:hypothetical protein